MTQYSRNTLLAAILLVVCLAHSVHEVQGQRVLKAEVKEEKCQHIHGQAFVGSVLHEMNTETHFKCCYQCHTKCDPTKTLCVGWEFHEKTGKCILYRDIFFMKFEYEVISGINDCFSNA